MGLTDLLIETERLIIITIKNESNGSKTNYAFLKDSSLTKDNISIEEYFKNPEHYTIVGYINIDRNNYIEYAIYKPYRGNGLATEMLIAVKEYCLSQNLLPNLYIDRLNDQSKKVAQKSGFLYEGEHDTIPNSQKWGIKK